MIHLYCSLLLDDAAQVLDEESLTQLRSDLTHLCQGVVAQNLTILIRDESPSHVMHSSIFNQHLCTLCLIEVERARRNPFKYLHALVDSHFYLVQLRVVLSTLLVELSHQLVSLHLKRFGVFVLHVASSLANVRVVVCFREGYVCKLTLLLIVEGGQDMQRQRRSCQVSTI